MPLAVRDDAHTAHVVPAADHHGVACIEFHVIQHLTRGDVDTHRVVDLHVRVGVAERAPIVSDGVRDALGTTVDLLHAAELVARLLLHDLVQHEALLGVVEQAEVLLRLLDLHDIHEASWVEHICAYLAIHLDQTLHHDHLHLAVGQGVLQALAEHHDERHALPHLVRARGWLRRPPALQLVQHPMRGRKHALQVLLRTARHGAEAGQSLNGAPRLRCLRLLRA
mmetsp:Transcript_58060/g.147305  ORF Transcript_58060/g.147305 Transcript_58060/m.147305 type:complete len:224 (-) Transcript_58060:7-678(-)